MHVDVDLDLCDGHGQCVLAAPAVFALGDDDDKVTLLTPEVPDGHEDAVREAVSFCPASALRLATAPSGV